MTRYGLFAFGAEGYAVPLLQLRKIVCQKTGYILPHLPAAIAEVLVDEGRLVPLLELAFLTPDGGAYPRTAQYKVFAESEAGIVAFPADMTCGIVAENKGVLLFPVKESVPGIIGTFNTQEKEFIILDIDFLAIQMTQRVL